MGHYEHLKPSSIKHLPILGMETIAQLDELLIDGKLMDSPDKICRKKRTYRGFCLVSAGT